MDLIRLSKILDFSDRYNRVYDSVSAEDLKKFVEENSSKKEFDYPIEKDKNGNLVTWIHFKYYDNYEYWAYHRDENKDADDYLGDIKDIEEVRLSEIKRILKKLEQYMSIDIRTYSIYFKTNKIRKAELESALRQIWDKILTKDVVGHASSVIHIDQDWKEEENIYIYVDFNSKKFLSKSRQTVINNLNSAGYDYKIKDDELGYVIIVIPDEKTQDIIDKLRGK